jgi:DNA modification methylase
MPVHTYRKRPVTLPRGDHPAMFPVELPRRCIGLGCPVDGVVLDPFTGSSTTGVAALEMGREFIGIDSSESYLLTSKTRQNPLQPVVDLYTDPSV